MRIFILVLLLSIACFGQEDEEKQPEVIEETEAPVETSFSCDGRVTGYYADVETGCKTYHYCAGGNRYTYQCPNNTLFQQRIFICNHWYLVDCGTSEQHYDANLLIGQKDKPFVGDDEGSVVGSTTTEAGALTSSAVEDIQRVEEPRRKPKSKSEEVVEVIVSDQRRLFFIPDEEKPVPTTSDRQFLIRRADAMRFKEKTRSNCPGRCDPRFTRPGTCSPCVTIR